MTFFQNGVQRYHLPSPPPSPGEDANNDGAKMHSNSDNLTPQSSCSVLPQQQQQNRPENGAAHGSGFALSGHREAAAFEGAGGRQGAWGAYGYDFEYQPRATAYYGYHSGWANWQQRQQEWDSSYPPPRPQPRPGQLQHSPSDSREYSFRPYGYQQPLTPPRESETTSDGSNGYACSQKQSPPAGFCAQQQPLTQHIFLTANDVSEEHTAPKTRAHTRSQGAPATLSRCAAGQAQSQSVGLPSTMQNARVDKKTRYMQASSGGDIVSGKTVRIATGPHQNLTGVVTSVTAKGAHVLLHYNGKALTLSKKELVVVGPTAIPLPNAAMFGKATAAMGEQQWSQGQLGGGQHFTQGNFGAGGQLGIPPCQSVTHQMPTFPFPGFVAPPPSQAPARPKPSSSQPKVFSMARPIPDHAYIRATQTPPSVLNISRPLLVILDLNGTLLYRKNKGSNFKPRPHLDEFLEYLFSNHVVMVWSSARPYNVFSMCQQFFSPEQFQRVAAIWTRDDLRLSPDAYNANTQVYKQLSWVWGTAAIQAKNPVPNAYWDQSNTVLLDDSVEKSASEPYNLIRIDEFEARPDQLNEDVLPQVALYLNTLRSQRDASAYIRSSPFLHDPSMPRAAAEAFAVARYAAVAQSPYLER